MYTIVRMFKDSQTLGEYNNLADARKKAKELVENGLELNLLICQIVDGIRKYLFTV